MGSTRPPIEGEPLEVLKAIEGWRGNGWRELRLYAEGFEIVKERPERLHVVRWADIEALKVGRVQTSNGVCILLRDGVPLSRMERFERRFGGKHVLVPPVFTSSHDELMQKFTTYINADRTR